MGIPADYAADKESDTVVNELDDGSEAFLNLYYQYQDLRAKNGEERKALRAAGGVVGKSSCGSGGSATQERAGEASPGAVC
jgi:hypothetical protein